MPAEGLQNDWPTVSLAKLPITRIGMEETADDFMQRVRSNTTGTQLPFYSTSANGQVVALCHQDQRFENLMRQADQIHADGMSLVIFSRWFCRLPLKERVATTDLVHAVAKRAAKAGARFYFLGASEKVNEAATAEMQKQYPGLIFAGRRNGYFSQQDEDAIVRDIVASKTDILWIGFGVPLEQQFISRNIEKLKGVSVIKTSGGLFDFLAGKNSRAPQWMQDMGFEWLYRMLLEPKRLGKRYLLTNPIALYALLKHLNAPTEDVGTMRTGSALSKTYRLSDTKTK